MINSRRVYVRLALGSRIAILTSLLSDLSEELTEQAYVNVLTRGDLSSLRWIASPLRHFVASSPHVQLCRVYYSSLNFRDIMLATGKLPPDAIPGKEHTHTHRHVL
jgi:hypothetical protein